MLFPITDSIYAPQIEKKGFFATVVRLESFEKYPGSRATAREHLGGSTFPFASPARERKLNAFLFSPITWNRKSECELIQSRAQLISNLTDKEAKFWRKRYNFGDPKMIPPISVWLYRDSIEVRFAMGLGDFISSVEVEVCPMDLRPYERQIGHYEHSLSKLCRF